MKYFIKTFGCQMNEADSFLVKKGFLRKNFIERSYDCVSGVEDLMIGKNVEARRPRIRSL